MSVVKLEANSDKNSIMSFRMNNQDKMRIGCPLSKAKLIGFIRPEQLTHVRYKTRL